MQFLLRFHRFRRLLNSATVALSSRIDAHTLAGPQRVFAFPQDVLSQASKASPEMSNYRLMKWYLASEACSLTQWYLERSGVRGGSAFHS